MKASNTKSLLKNFARSSGTHIVVGPNLHPKNKLRSPKWAVRMQHENDSLPRHSIAIENVNTVRANKSEHPSGCSYRATGYVCKVTPADVANMKPVKFSPSNGSFSIDGKWHGALGKLVLLPDGSTVGTPV